jgi:PilZ domain
MVRDLSLQGALISLEHAPRLQSELQVTMEAPSSDGLQSMKLRGYVVRIDAGAEEGMSAVGVVFTD